MVESPEHSASESSEEQQAEQNKQPEKPSKLIAALLRAQSIFQHTFAGASIGAITPVLMWVEYIIGRFLLSPFFKGVAATTGVYWTMAPIIGIWATTTLARSLLKTYEGYRPSRGEVTWLLNGLLYFTAVHLLYYGAVEAGFSFNKAGLASGILTATWYMAWQSFDDVKAIGGLIKDGLKQLFVHKSSENQEPNPNPEPNPEPGPNLGPNHDNRKDPVPSPAKQPIESEKPGEPKQLKAKTVNKKGQSLKETPAELDKSQKSSKKPPAILPMQTRAKSQQGKLKDAATASLSEDSKSPSKRSRASKKLKD